MSGEGRNTCAPRGSVALAPRGGRGLSPARRATSGGGHLLGSQPLSSRQAMTARPLVFAPSNDAQSSKDTWPRTDGQVVGDRTDAGRPRTRQAPSPVPDLLSPLHGTSAVPRRRHWRSWRVLLRAHGQRRRIPLPAFLNALVPVLIVMLPCCLSLLRAVVLVLSCTCMPMIAPDIPSFRPDSNAQAAASGVS